MIDGQDIKSMVISRVTVLGDFFMMVSQPSNVVEPTRDTLEGVATMLDDILGDLIQINKSLYGSKTN